MNLGPIEIAAILIVVLIIFGPGKLPDVGSALGKGIREFRKGKAGELDDPDEEGNQNVLSNKAKDESDDRDQQDIET